jgi:lysophospholipase L1-like esterase
MSAGRRGRLRRLLPNLALAAAVTLAVLGVGELLARWARARRGGGREDNALARYSEFDPRLGWRKTPGARATYRRREYTVEVAINSHGLRDPERGYAAPPGTRRVLALGDSFVEGYTVPLEQTVTQRLERALSRPGCAVEVINGGTAGYSTDQEYLFYQQEGVRYAPDVVLLFFYYNDVVLNTTDSYYGRLKPRLALEGDAVKPLNLPLPVPTPRPPAEGPPAAPARRWALFEWVGERLQRGAPRAYNALSRLGLWAPLLPEAPGEELRVYKTGPTPRIDGAWQLTCAIAGALRRGVESRGARLLAVHVPNRMEVDDRDRELTRLAYGMDDAGWDPARVRQRLQACGREQGFEVLDLVPALRRAGGAVGGTYLTFDPHWNARGHEAAAEAVAGDLRARGWLPACAGSGE